MKTVFVLMLLAILAALAGAGFFMLRKPEEAGNAEAGRARDPKAMARALALRVALSVSL